MSDSEYEVNDEFNDENEDDELISIEQNSYMTLVESLIEMMISKDEKERLSALLDISSLTKYSDEYEVENQLEIVSIFLQLNIIDRLIDILMFDGDSEMSDEEEEELTLNLESSNDCIKFDIDSDYKRLALTILIDLAEMKDDVKSELRWYNFDTMLKCVYDYTSLTTVKKECERGMRTVYDTSFSNK